MQIPTALRPGMTDVEFSLYYIALKDRNERRIQSQKRPSIWGGMGDYSGGYVGKTDEQMIAEAMARVSA